MVETSKNSGDLHYLWATYSVGALKYSQVLHSSQLFTKYRNRMVGKVLFVKMLKLFLEVTLN